MEPKTIEIKGAREHNLRNISLSLPRNTLICLTGVSGSGKSSLAFDTLFAEGQRRYIESLSSYARQFLGQLPKPDCDQITGLSPAIAIQQKTSGWNPRSTVGTVTGVHDFLRVLFARIGVQHCTKCDRPISAQSREQIIVGIMRSSPGERVLVLAPVARGQKGEFRDLFDDLLRQGYIRARVDGQIVELRSDLALQKNQRHDIEVVIDRLSLDDNARPRLAEAVETALRVGEGSLIIAPIDAGGSSDRAASGPGRDVLFSSRYACSNCGLSYEPPSPQLFSFNSPAGMCQTCDGLGERMDFDPQLLVPDPNLNFWAPCIVAMRTSPGKWRRHIYEGIARHLRTDLSQPWKKLSEKVRHALLYGTGDAHITYEWRWARGLWKHGGKFDGIVAELQEKYRKARVSILREYYEKFMRRGPCPDCRGGRLNAQALAVRIAVSAGRGPHIGPNLNDLCKLPIDRLAECIATLKLTPVQQQVVAEVLKEIRSRLEFLLNVGLHYLTLERTAPSLSGGESQRIRLASQIGSGLTGVLYVLDEPSIGLHPRDNQRLLDSLIRLRDMGNTVVVVEHDEETMRTADHVVDFGPGPGVRGGHVVAEGSLKDIMKRPESLTGQYLSSKREIEIPRTRRFVQQRTRREHVRK